MKAVANESLPSLAIPNSLPSSGLEMIEGSVAQLNSAMTRDQPTSANIVQGGVASDGGSRFSK
jgi:hypothetical protein